MSRIYPKAKITEAYQVFSSLDVGRLSALQKPSPDLRLCIVIPSLAEAARLPRVLKSLEAGNQRLNEAEVIVVVNNSASAGAEIVKDNQQTWDGLMSARPGPLKILALDFFSPGKALSPERAGVGLARRLGMDAAFLRLRQAGQLRRAAIACLDADSPVAPGYVDAVLETFDREDPPLAGICSYAHPWPAAAGQIRALIAYELWLRYFELGFYFSGLPYIFPAIGSCLVVTPHAYAQVRGLAPRKAGEDFHFFQKLAKASLPRLLATIPKAMVFPEARVSDRVPFGTGHGIGECLQNGPETYLQVEPAELFLEVRQFCRQLPGAWTSPEKFWDSVSPHFREFLYKEKAREMLGKFRENYPSPEQFQIAFVRWLGALRIIRYLNEQTKIRGSVWILSAFKTLLSANEEAELLSHLPCTTEPNIDWEALKKWLEILREFTKNAAIYC